jgi:hypothetical protein
VVELVAFPIKADPPIFLLSRGEISVLSQGAVRDAAVTGPALRVDTELQPIGLVPGEIMQMQARNDEVTAAEAEAGGAGEKSFPRHFCSDGDRSGLGALAIEPEICVFPFARGKDNGVPWLSLPHSFAGGLGIR